MTDNVTESPIRADYPAPLWLQAVKLISDDVASGRLVPGSRLPPERELCEQLGISRVTLRKALGQLVEDGVLTSSHGRGWFVTDGEAPTKDWPNTLESFSETAARMGLTASSRILESVVLPASIDEAEPLGIAPGTPILRLRRVRMLDDVPIAIDASITPVTQLPDAAEIDFASASLYDELAKAGSEPQRGDSTIEARTATSEDAEALATSVGAPVLVIRQKTYDRKDHPVSTSVLTYVGDRYRLRTVFVRAPR